MEETDHRRGFLTVPIGNAASDTLRLPRLRDEPVLPRVSLARAEQLVEKLTSKEAPTADYLGKRLESVVYSAFVRDIAHLLSSSREAPRAFVESATAPLAGTVLTVESLNSLLRYISRNPDARKSNTPRQRGLPPPPNAWLLVRVVRVETVTDSDQRGIHLLVEWGPHVDFSFVVRFSANTARRFLNRMYRETGLLTCRRRQRGISDLESCLVWVRADRYPGHGGQMPPTLEVVGNAYTLKQNADIVKKHTVPRR